MSRRRAVVLGGYGLIGSACMRALAGAGFAVTGIGRSHRAAMACDRDADWIIRDITAVTVFEWRELLEGVDVVVNAAGALQDGAGDHLDAIHVDAVTALVSAADALDLRIVQISAAGVSDHASTDFFRSKARGDARVATARDWVILRPVLVLSPEAYGGTALLRAVAALPCIQPRVLPGARVQTVHVDDLADAVVHAARGFIPSGTIADLTEPQGQSFPDLVASIRRWQGFARPRFTPDLPGALLAAAGRVADGLGHLGWRSPLRTTALRALADGIHGDPDPWQNAGGRPCRSLDATLASLPATRQERLYARLYLALPLAIATLSLFWLLSGIVALIDLRGAIRVLSDRAVPSWLAGLVAAGGAVADIALGLAILCKPWTRTAALGMAALSVLYLAGGLVFAPDLWADPLGPMVKVLPGIMLALLVWLTTDER